MNITMTQVHSNTPIIITAALGEDGSEFYSRLERIEASSDGTDSGLPAHTRFWIAGGYCGVVETPDEIDGLIVEAKEQARLVKAVEDPIDYDEQCTECGRERTHASDCAMRIVQRFDYEEVIAVNPKLDTGAAVHTARRGRPRGH